MNKNEIKSAVEAHFGVTVVKVKLLFLKMARLLRFSTRQESLSWHNNAQGLEEGLRDAERRR
ncbi:50S ribosomal protein L23 [Candidatus Minimicrobia naudis]|uniref:50S ribosomal protein L23 n=1 Tax=Candidatus Minimicrobia naudis TaxID=2841263 RepID=A0A8F1MAN4_9BACT|nr:50S ribosomal protein L23 [Candidatus Minimicrobia naudis]